MSTFCDAQFSDGDADDAVEAEVVEAVVVHRRRAFGGEALTPRLGQQAVPDLDIGTLAAYLSENQPMKAPVSRRTVYQRRVRDRASGNPAGAA